MLCILASNFAFARRRCLPDYLMSTTLRRPTPKTSGRGMTTA